MLLYLTSCAEPASSRVRTFSSIGMRTGLPSTGSIFRSFRTSKTEKMRRFLSSWMRKRS